MRNKKFMKGIIWGFEGLTILYSILSVIIIFWIMSDEAIMRMVQSGSFIAFCEIIKITILMIIIIKICRNMKLFLENAFSEDPFVKTSVFQLKNIYRLSWWIAILNLVEFNITKFPHNVKILVPNFYMFKFGIGISSYYEPFVNGKLSNGAGFGIWFGINGVFLIMIMVAAFAWILSVCFEKAVNMKNDNMKLKEESDLTI